MKKYPTLLYLLFFLSWAILLPPLPGWSQVFKLPGTIYQVQENGASGNKNQDATAIIQKGIDQLARAGGGTVYFAPGNYATKTLILKDNITIYLESGASLLASKNPEDYKISQTNFALDITKPVLFYAKNARNISFAGMGTVNGQAEHIWQDLKETDTFIEKETDNARAAGVDMKRAYLSGPPVCLFYLQECNNIRFQDITVLNSPNWGIHLQWSQDIFIRNLRIYSSLENGVNSDGIDIDGCKNVTISDCIIATGDDAICLKSTNKNGRYESVENITVANCVLTSTSAALKIGTETFGDFRHILFNNCIIRNSNRGIGILVRDGGTVENVLFSNITLDTQRKAFYWWGDGEAFRFMVLKRNENSRIGIIRDIVLENINGNCEGTSLLEGFSGKPLQNITLRNTRLTLHPEKAKDKRATGAIAFKNIKGLTLENTLITSDSNLTQTNDGFAISVSEVENLNINRFTSNLKRPGKNVPAIKLNNVSSAILENIIPFTEAEKPVLLLTGPNTRNINILDQVPKKKDKWYILRLPEVKRPEIKF